MAMWVQGSMRAEQPGSGLSSSGPAGEDEAQHRLMSAAGAAELAAFGLWGGLWITVASTVIASPTLSGKGKLWFGWVAALEHTG